MSHEVQGKPGSGTSGELATADGGADQQGLRRRLRRTLRARRRALGRAIQRTHAQAATAHLLASGLLDRGARRIALYLAADGELDTAALLAHLHATGACVALPRLDRRRGAMRLCLHEPGDHLVGNRYGLPEPLPDAPVLPVWTLSAVLLPLVGFDAAGHRLGMGGGYYDRLLGAPRLPRRPLLIGLAHACQQAEAVPTAVWDVPVDVVVTERGVLRCR